MDKYLASSSRLTKKFYHVLVGNDNTPILHPELFQARKEVRKDGKIVMHEKFEKTYAVHPWDLQDVTVKNWSSNNQYYIALSQPEKSAINAIKKFLNTEDWSTLVVFHDTECRLGKHYSHRNHLHIVVDTNIQELSKHGTYRSMQNQITKQGGRVNLSEITAHVDQFIRYLAEDEEKIFLGSNSDSLRELYKISVTETGQSTEWNLQDVENDNPLKNRTNIPFAYKTDVQAEQPDQDEPITASAPEHLIKNKASDSIQFLVDLFKKHSNSRDINSLISNYDVFSDTGRALCTIASQNNGDKIVKIALNQLAQEQRNQSLGEIIQNLKDDIKDFMTPRHSQAIFNTWCREQNISPRKYTCMMQMLLSGKGHKRIGVMLQGRPNSGKTALTNTMWTCIKDEVGKITKENFCFQDCPGKRIIIGEEISITVSNIENYKDLMSGTTLKCPIKNGQPKDCTPALVMLNSNISFTTNINREQIAALSVRLYNYENLKESKTLRHMTGNLHPKLFYYNVTPLSQDEIQYLKANENSVWDDTAIGYQEEFTGSWTDIPKYAMDEETTPQKNGPATPKQTSPSPTIEVGELETNESTQDEYIPSSQQTVVDPLQSPVNLQSLNQNSPTTTASQIMNNPSQENTPSVPTARKRLRFTPCLPANIKRMQPVQDKTVTLQMIVDELKLSAEQDEYAADQKIFPIEFWTYFKQMKGLKNKSNSDIIRYAGQLELNESTEAWSKVNNQIPKPIWHISQINTQLAQRHDITETIRRVLNDLTILYFTEFRQKADGDVEPRWLYNIEWHGDRPDERNLHSEPEPKPDKQTRHTTTPRENREWIPYNTNYVFTCSSNTTSPGIFPYHNDPDAYYADIRTHETERNTTIELTTESGTINFRTVIPEVILPREDNTIGGKTASVKLIKFIPGISKYYNTLYWQAPPTIPTVINTDTDTQELAAYKLFLYTRTIEQLTGTTLPFKNVHGVEFLINFKNNIVQKTGWLKAYRNKTWQELLNIIDFIIYVK